MYFLFFIYVKGGVTRASNAFYRVRAVAVRYNRYYIDAIYNTKLGQIATTKDAENILESEIYCIFRLYPARLSHFDEKIQYYIIQRIYFYIEETFYLFLNKSNIFLLIHIQIYSKKFSVGFISSSICLSAIPAPPCTK